MFREDWKRQGTDPARLAWGMLALFESSTVASIAESIGIRGSASLPHSLVAPGRDRPEVALALTSG